MKVAIIFAVCIAAACASMAPNDRKCGVNNWCDINGDIVCVGKQVSKGPGHYCKCKAPGKATCVAKRSMAPPDAKCGYNNWCDIKGQTVCVGDRVSTGPEAYCNCKGHGKVTCVAKRSMAPNDRKCGYNNWCEIKGQTVCVGDRVSTGPEAYCNCKGDGKVTCVAKRSADKRSMAPPDRKCGYDNWCNIKGQFVCVGERVSTGPEAYCDCKGDRKVACVAKRSADKRSMAPNDRKCGVNNWCDIKGDIVCVGDRINKGPGYYCDCKDFQAFQCVAK